MKKINKSNKEGITPLMIACLKGNCKIIEKIISQKININK